MSFSGSMREVEDGRPGGAYVDDDEAIDEATLEAAMARIRRCNRLGRRKIAGLLRDAYAGRGRPRV
jgi:hypothetical protein